MERDAHYAAVGIATVALLAALAVFTIWLARLQFNSEYDVYDIVFYGPVRGLSEGGEVHFNGIRVGEVTDLNLDPNKGDQVIARIRVDAKTPVRVTSRAQLEPQGITGLNYIQITAGDPNSAILKEQYPDNVYPVIQSQPSPISELLSGSGTVLAQTVDALNRINRVLSDDNVRSFSTSLQNIESLTTELEARKAMFEQLEQALARANSAVAEYERLAVSARNLVENGGAEAVANVNSAAEEAKAAAASINRSATNIEQPLAEFAASGLPQLQQTINELDDAIRSLQSLIDDVRSSPREFIARPETREMEVQP
ncbi:MlaD family protein [Brevundimonas sp. FT23042]|uniref:MlaD family protein n=1 Tax=Brevundimonas sp. FT23042 TaxID=3393749 RepID=UPI003B58751E